MQQSKHYLAFIHKKKLEECPLDNHIGLQQEFKTNLRPCVYEKQNNDRLHLKYVMPDITQYSPLLVETKELQPSVLTLKSDCVLYRNK